MICLRNIDFSVANPGTKAAQIYIRQPISFSWFFMSFDLSRLQFLYWCNWEIRNKYWRTVEDFFDIGFCSWDRFIFYFMYSVSVCLCHWRHPWRRKCRKMLESLISTRPRNEEYHSTVWDFRTCFRSSFYPVHWWYCIVLSWSE